MMYFLKNTILSYKYNSLRTCLTGLGVLIGIASIIIIRTISDSYSASLLNQYVNEGTIGLVVSSSNDTEFNEIMSSAEVIENLEAVKLIAGIKEFSASYQEESVDVYDENYNIIQDVVYEYQDVSSVIGGKTFNETTGSVAILKKNDEFESKLSVGDSIYVNGIKYKIVGITEMDGKGYPNLFFPERLKGSIESKDTSLSGSFTLKVKDGYKYDKVSKKVLETLNNNLDAEIKFIDYSEDTKKSIGDAISSVSMFLVLIGAISLVVATINVVNIMYISALEKMQEIAIYKALGMRSRQVIILFMAESMILIIIFAILGYLLGIIIAGIILAYLKIGISISMVNVIGILFISIVMGVIGSLKPAIRASTVSPATLLK